MHFLSILDLVYDVVMRKHDFFSKICKIHKKQNRHLQHQDKYDLVPLHFGTNKPQAATN